MNRRTEESSSWCVPGTVRTVAAIAGGDSSECDATLIGNRFMITSQQCSQWTHHGSASAKFLPLDEEVNLEAKHIDRTYYYDTTQQKPTTTDFQYAVLDLNEDATSVCDDDSEQQASFCSNAICSSDHSILITVPKSDDRLVSCQDLLQAMASGDFVETSSCSYDLQKVLETVCHCENKVVPPPPPAMQQVPPPLPGAQYRTRSPTTVPMTVVRPPHRQKPFPNPEAASQQELGKNTLSAQGTTSKSSMPMGVLAGLIVASVLLLFVLGLGAYCFIWRKISPRQRNDAIAAVEVDRKSSGESTDTSTGLKSEEAHSII